MCGVTGFIDIRQNKKSYDSKKIIENMTDTLKSRGPDDKGIWIDKKNNIFFGHRRLSIIDLSHLGKQPMISHNKRLVIIFNGEIYNFLDLKKDLLKENINFIGNSDTEVLIEAVSNWGIKKTLSKISGMFSFVIWDKKEKILYLARDRLGIKPLYYSFFNGIFFFGSQTKSFLKHPYWKNQISFNALASFFRLGYIPSGQSIFENTSQVLPGHYLIFSNKDKIKQKCYWSLDKIVKSNENKKKNLNIENEIEYTLNKSVKKHMISDVPIGSFLSGGVDSSLITLLMQKNSTKKIKTFNIGFENKNLDESAYASKIAKHIGTDHHNATFSNKNIIDLVPKLNKIYDEPFADSSQLPTILLSTLTKKKVKVALSGDGGDELFGGYNRYIWAKKIKLFYNLPYFVRGVVGKSLKIFTPKQWERIILKLPFLKNYSFPGDKIYKLSDVIQFKNFSEVYPYLISQWQKEDIPLNKKFKISKLLSFEKKYSILNVSQQMQLIDIKNYLPDDILTKVDRASMAYGLEVRVPYLEKELVELVWSKNLSNKGSKKILKNILYKYIPKNLIERPKMGFSIPLEEWLKGPLKEWASDLLQKKELENNYINSKKVIEKWNEHIAGTRNWQYQLWPILIYQSWKKSLIA